MIFALFCLGVVITLGFAITVAAVARAKDGFEDATGFHLESDVSLEHHSNDGRTAPTASFPTCSSAT
jgi:hypothetical protein